jgi:hypothetical protein
MNTINSAASLGIAAVNKQNLEVAEGKAIIVVDKIVRLNAAKKQSEKTILELQSELAELQVPCISESSVLGGSLPPAEQQNHNQKAIAAVIDKLAKSKVGCVEGQATCLTSAIAAEQAAIEAIAKDQAKLREELAGIKVEVLTETEVAGQQRNNKQRNKNAVNNKTQMKKVTIRYGGCH